MTDELIKRMAEAIFEIDGECGSEEALRVALATLEPGDFIRPGVLVESMETIHCIESRARDEGIEEMREQCAQLLEANAEKYKPYASVSQMTLLRNAAAIRALPLEKEDG